jgi:hypothetical protein
LTQFTLPEPLPVEASIDQFSVDRAIEMLEPLVEEPHPAGSPELAEVRSLLIQHLEGLGMQVEVQSATGTLPRYYAAGHADNIIARLPGSQSTGALLLMAHYDSVPQGPGAGDNGAGVVTILESLRALQESLPLKNDIVVLFTDNEEYGTLGAQAFAAQHPLMEEIVVVLNIEGTLQGSVVLVETGPENGWFVQSFKEASPHALGYSWLYDLFGLMPNLTDFIPFRESGYAGGNLFAFNGGSQYHTPRDTIENLDPRSLQQHGEQTLALIQHFGQIDLSEPQSSDVIYFNILKNWMVVYPSEWAAPLVGFVFLLIVVSLGLNIRKKQVSFKQLFLSLLAALGIIVTGLVAVILGWFLITKLHPQYNLYFPAHTYNDGWYAVGFAFLAAATAVWLSRLSINKLGWRNLLGGVLLLLGAISIPVSIFLPGFSYLFTWPVAFALLPLNFLNDDEAKLSLGAALGLGMLFAPPILLWLPVGAVLYWSTGLDFLSAIAIAVVVPILLSAAQLKILTDARQRILTGLLLAAAAVCLVGGSVTSGFDAQHPMPLRVQYFLNADTGEASWINQKETTSEWRSQFMTAGTAEVSWQEVFPPYQSTILRSPAPVTDLPAPTVTILEDTIIGDARTIRLHVAPTRRGDELILSFAPGSGVYYAEVEGQSWMEPPAGKADNNDRWQTFFYAAPPEEGIEILFTAPLPGPESMLIAERSVGLESLPDLEVTPRPASLMSIGDYVFVSQTILLNSTDH